MSLNTMSKRMSREIPNLSDIYARTLLDEALGVIEDERLWSFQCAESNWLTPGLLFPANNAGVANSAGTVTVQPGSQFVIGDATASASWTAYVNNANAIALLTSCQFRNPSYSLYNIIQTDIGGPVLNPPFVTLTLDRVWGEPGGSLQPYMIYQAYFPGPVTQYLNQTSTPNFKRFFDVRDTTNNYPLDYWSKTQRDLAYEDPQRTIFTDPAYVIPYEVDVRPGSSTFGNMLYELWPHPLSILPYSFHYAWRGPRLQAPGDLVPYPLTEEVVLEQGRVQAMLYKEANKGENVERGSGADFKFLAQAHGKIKEQKLKPLVAIDATLIELYKTRFRPDAGPTVSDDGYATTNSGVNIGRL